MKRNVTVSIDEDILRRVEHKAARHEKSVSDWIGYLMEKTVGGEKTAERVQERALARLEKGFHLGGKPLTREKTHVR